VSNGNHTNHTNHTNGHNGSNDDSFLNGWKEISEFLRTSESTAKRWHRHNRLPVCTAVGGVFCRKEWLFEWADSQRNYEIDRKSNKIPVNCIDPI